MTKRPGMTCAEFAAEADALGFRAAALANLLARSRSAISHYRTTDAPPVEVVKKLRRLAKLLKEFKREG